MLKKYFVITKKEVPILEEKRQRDYIKNKLNKIKQKKELYNLVETKYQLQVGQHLINEGVKFIGKTNMNNLIFNNNGVEIKMNTYGDII